MLFSLQASYAASSHLHAALALSTTTIDYLPIDKNVSWPSRSPCMQGEIVLFTSPHMTLYLLNYCT